MKRKQLSNIRLSLEYRYTKGGSKWANQTAKKKSFMNI